MKKLLKPVFCAATLIMLHSSANAEVSQGKFAVGLNYPGAAIRYFLNDALTIEARGQFAEDIIAGGLRSCYYFSTDSELLFFGGLEGDFVSFTGDESEGTGFAGELLVGSEYFFTEKLSLQADAGPAWVAIEDKDTSVTDSGVEFVINLGINFYFGGY